MKNDLAAENARLRAALAYYADAANWRVQPIRRGLGEWASPAVHDSGQVARRALDETGGRP